MREGQEACAGGAEGPSRLRERTRAKARAAREGDLGDEGTKPKTEVGRELLCTYWGL